MSGYLNAQKLNRRVEIQRKVAGSDSWGQPTEQWVRVCKLWAHIKTITGSGFVNQEFVAGDIEVSRPTASVRVRKRDGITAGMRLVHGTTNYDIKVVLPDLQDNRYMDIGVATGANQG
jgi:SPP1 family predicted phage head-tail adaptor